MKCERVTLRPGCTSRLQLTVWKKKKAHRTVGEQSCHLSTHQQTRTHTRTHTQTGSKISQRHFTKKPNKQPTEQTVPLAELISAATMPLKGAAETQTDEADLDPSQVLSNLRLRANSWRQDGVGTGHRFPVHGYQRAEAKLNRPALLAEIYQQA